PHLIETAEVLAKIDPDRAREEATPILRALLHDSMRRIPAAVLLQQLHPDGSEGLAALAENLREPNGTTRRLAADALGKLGPAARSASGALREALSDSSASVRMRAAFALWRVRGETRTTLPILLEILEKAVPPAERGEAASYLGQGLRITAPPEYRRPP